ncbi:MAG: FHA domain-containing protein [Brachymonas sp.]|nr:FHA domain-containing protein [Brachymonas sp.]
MAKLVVTLDEVVIREVVLDRDHLSLGRRPYNHIVIDNLAVSGDHAIFQFVDGHFHVEDMGSTNGTAVNGVKVKRQRLHHGDTIGIAKFRLQFHAPPTEAQAPLKTTGVLNSAIRVMSGTSAGRSVMLSKPVTTLGKPGIAVASITRRAENFVLRYIEGSRPLTCNGNVIAAREHILLDGDEIDLAGVLMRFDQQADSQQTP